MTNYEGDTELLRLRRLRDEVAQLIPRYQLDPNRRMPNDLVIDEVVSPEDYPQIFEVLREERIRHG